MVIEHYIWSKAFLKCSDLVSTALMKGLSHDLTISCVVVFKVSRKCTVICCLGIIILISDNRVNLGIRVKSMKTNVKYWIICI